MIFLLDVNALVALGFHFDSFHAGVAIWLQRMGFPPLATCSITELGFLRILVQARPYGISLSHARLLLRELKTSPQLRFTFFSDGQDSTYLPAWVTAAKQITDGHLLQLARANGAAVATLDTRIPEAFLIP
jgi:predicted nucleic acid-binding protein